MSATVLGPTKVELKALLQANSVPFTSRNTRDELVDLVNTNNLELGESFGPVSEEEKQALAERTSEEEVCEDITHAIISTIEQCHDIEVQMVDAKTARLQYIPAIEQMIVSNKSKRSIARFMIQHGWQVNEATKELQAMGVAIRYQQIYQATADLRAAQTANSATATCRVCGRPLSDPDHAAAGLGPICAAKASMAGKSFKQ